MDKNIVIKTLRVGLLEAINLIEHLNKSDLKLRGQQDPAVEQVWNQLKNLIEKTENANDEPISDRTLEYLN